MEPSLILVVGVVIVAAAALGVAVGRRKDGEVAEPEKDTAEPLRETTGPARPVLPLPDLDPEGGTTKIDRSELLGITGGHATGVQEAFFVVIAGDGVGRLIKLERNEHVIGRDPILADISFRDDAISKRHAKVSLRDGVVEIEDLGSSNGTFVDGEQITKSRLADGARVVLGRSTVLTLTFQDELGEQFQQRMYESSTRDQLTKAYNKATFLDQLHTEMRYAARHNTNYLLAIMDIDHFKAVNDTHGHLVGDEVLAQVSKLIRMVTREDAMFARYGGEEFIIAERNATMDDGEKLTERIRRTVAEHKFETSAGILDITLSIGHADLSVIGKPSARDLIDAADNALYAAKHAGRNCVRRADELD